MVLFCMAFFRPLVLVFRDLRHFVRRNLLFRLFAKRYFVFSFFFRVAFFALFPLFACRYFVFFTVP